MLSLPRLLDSLPLSIGRGCSLSWPQEVTPGQSPRCSSGCSCEDGGISGGFPGLSKRKVFLLLRPQKGTRQRQGKRILPSQPSCVRWTLSQTHPFPNVQGGGPHITSLGPKAAEFLIPEGSKDIFQGNFFFICYKTPLRLTYVPGIFFSWTNSHFKNRTLKKICKIIKNNNKQKKPIISPVSQLMFQLQLSAISAQNLLKHNHTLLKEIKKTQHQSNVFCCR